MPTILNQLRDAFRTAIRTAYHIDADPLLVQTGNEKFGDYQCNAAMALAKTLKLKPRDVAEKIKTTINLSNIADKLDIAGPGFINVFLAPKWVETSLARVSTDPRLGVETKSNPQTVVIDYPSPNIAKEMHIGHLRPANIGDACSRVLEFAGDRVIRQNHVGDWGTSFGMLMEYMRGHGDDAALSDIEQFYKAAKAKFDADPAFADASRKAVVRLQAGAAEELGRWRQILDISRSHMEQMLALLNVKITRSDERGESFYNPRLPGVVTDLLEKQVAVESDGAAVVWVKPFEAPMIIRKSDGGFGYATTDLAALKFRTQELGAERIIVLTDMRQRQHFQMFTDAGRRAGYMGDTQFDHVMFGAILGPDGKPIKSKSGESVKLKDVLDEAEQRGYELAVQKDKERVEKQRAAGDATSEPLPQHQLRTIGKAVGVGAVKYGDLSKDRASDYVFDWDTMLALDGNTAPYLQYPYARICQIFRKSGEPASAGGTTITLSAPEELTLAKHILRLGEVIDSVARELKPHLLCAYLYDLATRFSSFYENCPVLKSEEPARSSRLALCALTARTMATGLDLLGIEHPDQM